MSFYLFSYLCASDNFIDNCYDRIVYYPPTCPHNANICAKIVPSFILAGGELTGTSYVYNQLLRHPQVLQHPDHNNHASHVFDSPHYDEARGLESYLSHFPSLDEETINRFKNNSKNGGLDIIAGENAAHYLYASYLTAKRIKETLPDIKVK